jgi:hypothetical protein
MPMCAFKIIICIQIILANEVVKIANFNCFQKKIYMGKFSHYDDPKNGNFRFWCKFENNWYKNEKISKILKPQHCPKST